ncbi:hypothetical protein AAY473_035295 [Plecturocebus cupreus]
MHHHIQLIFVFLVEMGFHHVGQADLKLLTSSDLPVSASQKVWWLTPVIPATWEAEAGEWLEPRRQRLRLGNRAKLCLKKKKKLEVRSWRKKKKISWAWWHVPAVPAIGEAEVGESLEPRRQRLQAYELQARFPHILVIWDSRRRQQAQLSPASVAFGRKTFLRIAGWAWWLTPVTPALWEAEVDDHLRSGV